MKFSPSFLDEIRDRVPISTIVGRRVTFDRKKSNPGRGDHWACCPFHGEKSPSFHCEDRKGRYHCFGCGVSGDHFKFLTELEGMSFPEAVETVAGLAGVPMPARDPEAEKREKERSTLYDVMELASRFFEAQLQDAKGAVARGYLRERGISSVTQQTFRIGYAPDSRNALKEFLSSKGVPKDQIEASGLTVFGDDIPVSYDRFRDRIIFPIEDVRGRVVGFGGRALNPNDKAKYLNSPETELFHKGRNLFNISRAKDAVSDKSQIIVVEGYVDAISLYQAGIRNVVAPLGTALTEDQVDLLWRFSKEPVICFDGDLAGIRAANRVVDVVFPKLKSGYSAKFMAMPDGQDPDDFIKSKGRAEFEELTKKSIPLHEFFIVRHQSQSSDSSPEMLAKVEKDIYSDIDRIADPLVKRYYRSHVRLRLYEMVGRSKNFVKREDRVTRESLSKSISQAQRIMLGLCVEYPGLIIEYVEQLSALDYESDRYANFFHELHRLYIEFPDISINDIYDKIDDQFYDTLCLVHGDSSHVRTRTNNNGFFFEYQVKRGHSLYSLFPMLRFEPSFELIKMTMNFYLLKLEFDGAQRHYIEVAPTLDAAGFEAMQRQVLDLESRVRHAERELDIEYQVLAGRTHLVA